MPLGQGGSYEAGDRLTAGYGMVDLALSDRFRLVTGARVEHSAVDVTARQEAELRLGSITLRVDYEETLPRLAFYNVASRRPQGPIRISNRIYQDPTRINNIREYVPGDPLNTIHWKVTARTSRS